MKIDNFFAELKRRNVYKVAVAYAVVGWLAIQICSTVLPAFHAPEWVVQTLIVLVAVGFPIALVLAWAFELTPEGIKRAEDVDPNESITPRTGRKLIGITIVLAVIATGLFAFRLLQPKTTTTVASSAPSPAGEVLAAIPNKSIAVLPFDNLSRDPDNAYFAEGVQDEILTRLAKVADLKVISRTSTQHFKSSPDDLPKIAKQLGVANILEGSVQKSNDQVRVNVQLINATNDAHLWADIYDRKLTDLFAAESDIAKTIADTLQAKLTGSEERALSARPTENPEAYQLYLKGRYFWNKRTAADLQKSIDYFKQAIEKDPGYALAYAAEAQSWLLLPAYDGGAPNDCFPQAEALAEKALALDPSSSDAHAAIGGVKSAYAFNPLGAVAELKRAIELNPNDATAHHWLGNHPLTALGQLDRALAEIKRAQELDPLSLIINTNIGYTLMYAGRLDEAIAQLRKTVELDGSFYYARSVLGQALELKGSFPEAMSEYHKTVALTNDAAPLGFLGHLYGQTGRKEEAEQILEKLRERREQRYTPAYPLALVSLGLGDREAALHWLEESYREREGFDIEALRLDPFLKPLHGDPRFEALAEKVLPAREFAKAAIPSK